MCGICGMVLDDPGAMPDPQVLSRMNRMLTPRGPDEEGSWTQPGVGLAARRLRVIDVAGSRQPTVNEDQTVRVVFNGEIYNFRELRESLIAKGHRFASQGDTEVLVHLYEEEGAGFVKRLRGMFAFALWDAARRQLVVARDRLGIKPLYYTHQRGAFIFASELKALLQHPLVERRLDPRAVDGYFTYGYIPAPQTIFQDIYKLEPATVLTVHQGRLAFQKYWELSYADKIQGTMEELSRQFLEQAREAVRSHLVSDVPLGAFLSGGLDSSTVVALMSEASDRPVKTFSIGFEGGPDELRYAGLAAARFRTDHHKLVVRPQMAELLPKLVWAQDEPLFDNSMVPTFLVSRLAREHVTVALSGDGGDELLGGYEWTRRQQLVDRLRRIPAPLRRAVLGAGYAPGYDTGTLARVRRAVYDTTLPMAEAFARRTTVAADLRTKLYAAEFRRELQGYDAAAIQRERFTAARVSDERERMLASDTAMFLPDDCLFKVDRMSMANSLEVRVPLLDHRLVEFSARLPFACKIQGLTTKRILKHAMRAMLPPEILRQRKQGFTMPIDAWLRGPLGGTVERMILGERAARRRLLNPETLRWMWREHRQGRRDFSHRLWSVLVFELWARLYMDRPSLEPTSADLSVMAAA